MHQKEEIDNVKKTVAMMVHDDDEILSKNDAVTPEKERGEGNYFL